MASTANIRSSALFRALDDSQVTRIAGLATSKTYSQGTMIIREGEVVEDLFLIETGLVRLTMGGRAGAGDVALRAIVDSGGSGDAFGWSAIVEPYLATLSVETLEPCTLLSINGRKLVALLDEDPLMGYRVMTALAGLVASRLKFIALRLLYEV